MNVLFVCTGNTCRSAMAEEIAEDIGDQSSTDFKFKSAGTFACEGDPATREANEAMEEIGLDIEKHKSSQFDKELAEWADIILAMEAKHIEEMEAMAPEEEHKMHTLLGYAEGKEGYPGEEGFDIIDPYKGDIDIYRETRDQLKEAIETVISKLEKNR
jgi:protein-tyrosine-phosphatase